MKTDLKTQFVRLFFVFAFFAFVFLNVNYKPRNAVAAPFGAFCSSGQALCSAGFFASCSDSSYSPKCVNSFLDCCRNNIHSLDCKPELFVCSSIPPTPSTSSSSGAVKPYCFNEEVVCDNGFPACLDKNFSLTCVNFIPDCCKKKFGFLDCRPELLACVESSEDGLGIDRFNTIDVSVVSSPNLPDIVQLPLVVDELQGKVGFAFSGSSPSFEIKLPVNDPNLRIVSVDLKDSTGKAFENVPFVNTNISGTFENLILSLNIPETVSPGGLRFALGLNNSNSVAGLINIINPFEVQEFFGEKLKDVFKPEINRVFLLRDDGAITLILRGKHFVGKKIFYKNGELTSFLEKSKNDPITQVTILPSNLDLKIIERRVLDKGRTMKIKLKPPQILKRKVKAVLVISTPSGITSKSFVIK